MKLSTNSYALKCVLAAEVLYVSCSLYGLTLLGARAELHKSLFELMPWYSWGNPLSILCGAILVGIVAWIGGTYIVWMHNSSMVNDK